MGNKNEARMPLKKANLIILLLIVMFMVFGISSGKIVFGMGLGDVFGWLILFVTLLILAALTYFTRNKGEQAGLLVLLSSASVLLLAMLYATIWRADLYKWNGAIFFDK